MKSLGFTKRLQMLLDYYNLSASAFANKIGIQRSSMSHVLSGRNKPSLDFVMKVLHTFEEVTIEWLIDGNGEFPKSHSIPTSTTPLVNEPQSNDSNSKQLSLDHITIDNSKNEIESKTISSSVMDNIVANKSKKTITRIIICFNDNTFESYETE